MPLDRCLIYLAGLKGLSVAESKSRLAKHLDRFELSPHRMKKVKELSKGMQQKAQLIAALIHEPEVIIIDEPFSALDPVNTQMVKDLLDEERQKGRAVVMCTHQMHQVEELCDRLVLIDHGKAMLYGTLAEIRQKYATQDILLNASAPLPTKIPGVERIVDMNAHKKLVLKTGYSTQSVLSDLVRKNVPIEHFEIAVPSLDEIFIRVVTEGAPKA
jgi:ABC-2 type transport system ATP-binding protein